MQDAPYLDNTVVFEVVFEFHKIWIGIISTCPVKLSLTPSPSHMF